jgi:signal transduction histidine kinase
VRKFVAALSTLTVFFLANIWATFVIRLIYANNNITEDFGMGLVLILTSLIAALAAALLRGFKNIKRNMAISPMVLIIIAMVMFALFISYIFLALLSPRADGIDSIHVYMVIFIHTIPIGFIILLFYILDTIAAKHEDKIKSALQAQEKEYYYAQCQLMQESVENIKSMRHDMKLHLATTRDFISTDKTGEATAYLNGLLGDIEESGVYSNTNNTAFDSIINFKLNNAKQENIKLDIRLLIPPALNIEVADIVTIIGNLLDNALDAVSKVEDKRVKLDIEYSRESLFIQVENTFDGVVKYDSNTDDKRISTRKSGGEHGHGLKNIRKSVEKYNGHIDITHDENIFTATVLLYVDDM